MAKNAKAESCCSVDAVVTVDARGQIVLPKELRSAAGIKRGRQACRCDHAERGQGVLPFAHESRAARGHGEGNPWSRGS